MERSLDETRDVINVWSDYSDRLSNAISDLGQRIDKSFMAERNKQLKKELNLRKLDKIRRPTKLCLTRKRDKFMPISEASISL